VKSSAFSSFSARRQEPDENLVDTLNLIGVQIGHFIQQKRAAEACTVPSAKRRIRESALDAIITLDDQGRFPGAQSDRESMFGHDVLPCSVGIGRSPFGGRRNRTVISALLRSEKGEHARPTELEMHALHADGREVNVELAMARSARKVRRCHGMSAISPLASSRKKRAA